MDYAVKQKREILNDIINCAKPGSSKILVIYWQKDFIQMQKAFNRRLRRKAAAKNFTLELRLHT